MRKKRKQSGFTLAETLIAFFLVAFLLAAVMPLAERVINIWERSVRVARAAEEAHYIWDVVQYSLRYAKKVADNKNSSTTYKFTNSYGREHKFSARGNMFYRVLEDGQEQPLTVINRANEPLFRPGKNDDKRMFNSSSTGFVKINYAFSWQDDYGYEVFTAIMPLCTFYQVGDSFNATKNG